MNSIINTIKFLCVTQLVILFGISVESEDYIWPTETQKTITAVFGDIRPFRYHTGIDVRTYGMNGLDVFAIQDGYVSRIAVSSTGYGKVIYIKMKDGNTSVYAHLDRFNDELELVKSKLQNDCKCYSFDESFSKGQLPVKQGDVIGYTGDTGGISGPHLHFEIRNKKGRPFNPLLTNYKIHDTLAPIPKKLIISATDKSSRINGNPSDAEFELTKISDNRYLYDGIISVNGEFGISLEIYDKIKEYMI